MKGHIAHGTGYLSRRVSLLTHASLRAGEHRLWVNPGVRRARVLIVAARDGR